MSESSAVSPESVNKNTPESPKNKVKKKKSLWKILLAIILILVVLVCLLLCGVRAYFRLSVREYYKNSEKTFEIPGLSEGLIPQGLCYDENTKEFLVTGYRSDNQPSQISVVGKESGEEVKRVGLLDRDGKEYCGHVGGISLKGNYLYVAGSEGLLVYSYKDLKAAASGETIQALGIFSTATEDDKLGVAFTHVEGSYIYVGEFYRESNYPTPDSHKYTTAAGALRLLWKGPIPFRGWCRECALTKKAVSACPPPTDLRSPISTSTTSRSRKGKSPSWVSRSRFSCWILPF